MQSLDPVSIRCRLAVVAPFALTSVVLLALTMRAWTHCNGSPCLAFLVMGPVLLVGASAGVASGWFATSPSLLLRWSARVVGAALWLIQLFLIAVLWSSPA